MKPSWKGTYPEEKAIQGFSKSWLLSELAMKFAKNELKTRRWHRDYTSIDGLIDDIDGWGVRRTILDILNN